MSATSASSAASASVASFAGAAASSVDGTACAFAGTAVKPRPAATTSSPAKPYPVLEVITPPACL
jgi:hypothetical protein